MSNVLTWMKSNVVIVACLVVMAIAMLSLLWPTGSAGAAFQKELDTRPQQLTKINSAIRRNVNIPSQDPNSPPIQVNITVNDNAVRELERIFQRMNSSYGQLYKDAVAFNQFGPNASNPHKPMIDGLFGVTNPPDSLIFRATSVYQDTLMTMYHQPALKAGTPPTAAEITRRLEEVKQNFVATYLGAAAGAATDPGLIRQQAEAQRDLLFNRARSVGIYMDPPQFAAAAGGANVTTGFQFTKLAAMSERPDMPLLWESQMQLWIQQDLLYAVALANHLDARGNVMQAPVKRLLAMTVKPGYIGAPVRLAGDANPPAPDNINQRLPDNFLVSPTGRRSNPLYDVRMATLSVLIDARRIPELLNAIGQTNFMTPIIDKISPVDQLDLMTKGGYVFGDNVDVVQLDLTVETIWLRRWTAGQTDDGAIEEYKLANPNAPDFANKSREDQVKYLKDLKAYDLGLMPDVIRWELGMPTRDPDFKPAGMGTQGPGGTPHPGGGFPGDPGMGPGGPGPGFPGAPPAYPQ